MTEQIIDKLVPSLRKAMQLIKIVVYVKVKKISVQHQPKFDENAIRQLTAQFMNIMFDAQYPTGKFSDIAGLEDVQQIILSVSLEHPELTTLITDTLRIQYLCDQETGLDRKEPLVNAEKLGILQVDRSIPLPKSFIELANRLGNDYGLNRQPGSMANSEK